MGLLNTLQTDPQAGIILIIALVFSLSFHEFAHAYVAYRLGDNTAAYQGRLTLNPLAHLDPIGSLMLLFIGFGYAKPVPVNPMNLQNPRIDMIVILQLYSHHLINQKMVHLKLDGKLISLRPTIGTGHEQLLHMLK